jgi:hypothetical protein
MAYEGCPFDVTPYDTSNLVKTPNLVSVNYTNQDFWSMKSRLIDYIQEQFEDSFNDFVESDLAIMLIENWAFIADTLSFKMDQIANEIFIDTVSETDNAFRLSQLVGFTPQPPIGATSMWSATINTALQTDLIIDVPQRVEITTDEGLRIIELYPADSNNQPVLDEDIIITAGQFVNANIVGVEGFTTTINNIGTGDVGQSVSLPTSPVIGGSIRVYVDGLEWTEVEYFTDSQPRKEFRVEYNSEYEATVIFGNNRAGMIPSNGSTIDISYRVGGGTAGNIVTGVVELQRNFLVPGFEFRIPVSFTNYTRGTGGYSGDDIDDIKNKIGPWIRTQSRVVAGSDYETYANQYATEYHGQIGKSKASLRNHGCSGNVIDLFVLALDEPDNLIEASNELKVSLQDDLETYKMITDIVCIKDGVVVEVDVAIDMTVDKFYRKFEEEMRERVQRRIFNFFALNNWDYGKTLKAVDLIKELADIKEIRSVEVDFQTTDADNSGEIVTTAYYEIIRPSTYELNFVYE